MLRSAATESPYVPGQVPLLPLLAVSRPCADAVARYAERTQPLRQRGVGAVPRRIRRAVATVAAVVILVFGVLVGAWLSLVGTLAAVVQWPLLPVMGALFAGLAWQATAGEVTHGS